MRVNQDDKGLRITCFTDKRNYNDFLNDIKKLGKKYEYNSDVDKLTHAVIFYGQRVPYIDTKGWTSRVITKEGIHHVLFLDYDEILYDLMVEELEYVCQKHNMSPFYVFTTYEKKDSNGRFYGNYMAISLTKKRFGEIVNIQNELHCDSAYKKIALIYRFKCWVLRLSSKGDKPRPKFKGIIGHNGGYYIEDVSRAHLELLKKLYPEIPYIKYTNLDNNKKIYLSKYKTASL